MEDYSACRALFVAINNQDIDTVKRIVKTGINTNCTTDDGWTPLLEASKDGPVELVELLLKNNANPNIASDKGYTPLMRASGCGQEEIVRVLLQHNANAGFRDIYGQNAARIARAEYEFEIADLVDEYCAQNLLNKHKGLSNEYQLQIVAPHISLMIHTTRKVVGGYVYRLDVTLKNGEKINQCKIIDELLLLLPLDIDVDNIKSYSVPFQQMP